MKTKRYIAYFLFFISMIMLTVPVIPHHHHEDGMICMKTTCRPTGVATIKTLATNIAAAIQAA